MKRGDIVLMHFPFSSGAGGKVRPAVVVQNDSNNARLNSTIVAMISSTTKLARAEPTQLLIDPASADGRSSGLLHPSAVKCENLFTVEQRLVLRAIGSLTPSLMSAVDDRLKAAIGIR